MGLDMYLTGDKFFPTCQDNLPRALVDGFPVSSQKLDLGQWRKHWALHNYITDNFNPEDTYSVEIEAKDLRKIADVVALGELVDPNDGGEMPHYQARYDYHREPEQVAKTVGILRKAADWLDAPSDCWKSVEYYGSW